MNRHLAKPTWLCSAQQYWESEVGSNWMRQLVQAGCRSRHKWKGTLAYPRSSCGKGSSHKPPKLMNQQPNLYSELSRSVVAKGWMRSRPTMHSSTRWTTIRRRCSTAYASQKKSHEPRYHYLVGRGRDMSGPLIGSGVAATTRSGVCASDARVGTTICHTCGGCASSSCSSIDAARGCSPASEGPCCISSDC